MAEHFPGQMGHKIEYAGILPLVLAECFIVHKEVDNLAIAIDTVDPGSEFVGHQGVFVPLPIAEAKRDIITE
jgi:hypothetical protein